MPASTRHHRALAVFVYCLGILAAVPALPGPAAAQPPAARPPAPPAAATAPAGQPSAEASAEPDRPSAPPALPSPTQAAAPPPKPPVTVAVASENTAAPSYRIQVRNDGNRPIATTVRQELPPGTSATSITDGGRPSHHGGTAGTEVTWDLRLPARSTTTLNTKLSAPPDTPLTAPACAFAAGGERPYDCATATWRSASTPAAAEPEPPLWQRPAALLTGLGGLAAFAVGGWWTWQRQRQRRRHRTQLPPPHPGGRGTIYPRPAAPTAPARRRRPSTWLLVPVAAVLLASTVGAATWTATRKATAVDTDSHPTSGAWLGTGAAGAIGEPLREAAFEFTVYRISCEPTSTRHTCAATVGVQNRTPEQQTWYGPLQRAYLADGNFVGTDEQATRRANQGRDVFAKPLAGGSRMVLPLIFSVHGQQPPTQLELRSGVFSAGVRVDVP